MRRRVVEWLLFFFFFFLITICCNNALLFSSTESAFNISSEAAVRHDAKPFMEEKQLNKSVFKSDERTLKGSHEALHLRDDDVVEEEMKVITGENKKGKGTYGGGDLLRPRAKKSGAANSSLLKSSSLFSPLLLRYLILGTLQLAIIFFF